MTDKVTVEMNRELARELSAILHHEVEEADEICQTENTMLYGANVLEEALEG